MPKEPPPEYEFLADPPSISAFDLGIGYFPAVANNLIKKLFLDLC